MRKRLLSRAGIPEHDLDLQGIRKAQWSPKFEYLMHTIDGGVWSERFITLMKNRLVMGSLRYGLSDDPEKKHFACIDNLQERWALWEKTGDSELLVDVANLALLTFVEGNHPKAHVSRNYFQDPYYTEFWGSYYNMHGDKGELVCIAFRAMKAFVEAGEEKFGLIGAESPKATLQSRRRR